MYNICNLYDDVRCMMYEGMHHFIMFYVLALIFSYCIVRTSSSTLCQHAEFTVELFDPLFSTRCIIPPQRTVHLVSIGERKERRRSMLRLALALVLSFLAVGRAFHVLKTSTSTPGISVSKLHIENPNPSTRWSEFNTFEKYFQRPGPWDDKDLDSLLKANKAWSGRMKSADSEFFTHHEIGHAPKILWIGCSDARVPANEIIGEEPGSVFVHRNIANLVNNNDFNCLSVIQYAVDVLQVKHIIVCGHYDCGGIRASLESVDHKSPLENWLRNIRDTYRLHRRELNDIPDVNGAYLRMTPC